MHSAEPSQTPKNLPPSQSYFSYVPRILNGVSRGTFKLAVRTVGCYIGSALAGNACLLYAPALLNHLGYQVGVNVGLGLFGSWASGQATLSISYYRIDGAARALGGVLGATLGGWVADALLFAFDRTVELVISASKRVLQSLSSFSMYNVFTSKTPQTVI
jgi:hypothetical protein